MLIATVTFFKPKTSNIPDSDILKKRKQIRHINVDKKDANVVTPISINILSRNQSLKCLKNSLQLLILRSGNLQFINLKNKTTKNLIKECAILSNVHRICLTNVFLRNCNCDLVTKVVIDKAKKVEMTKRKKERRKTL